MTDWEKIRTGFVKDGLSYRALSREFAAPYSTIQRRGIKEDWPGQREEYLEENVGEKMKQVKTKLLRRIERTLDEDRELDSNHVHHTALYIGGGQLVQASINELGTATGGTPGDQTGREICERGYYNYPWDCVLRYGGSDGTPNKTADTAPTYFYRVSLPLLKPGMADATVKAVQGLLMAYGYFDGLYHTGRMDTATVNAVKDFQTALGLDADGEVGSMTWTALLTGR